MVKDFPFISNSSYYVFIDRIRSSKYYLSLMNSENLTPILKNCEKSIQQRRVRPTVCSVRMNSW